MGTLTISIFAAFVIYTIACIMDGQDVKPHLKRYVCWEKYNNDKYIRFVIRFGTWRASDNVNILKDKVYVLPCICYYYNYSEFYIGFAWLVFECFFLYKDWDRQLLWEEQQRKKFEIR